MRGVFYTRKGRKSANKINCYGHDKVNYRDALLLKNFLVISLRTNYRNSQVKAIQESFQAELRFVKV